MTTLILEVEGSDEACDIAQDILDQAGHDIREALDDARMKATVVFRGDNMLDTY